MNILVDIDDVCCDLLSTWLTYYNKDYDDNLTKEQITDWDTSKFVKPECGVKIFKYLENPSLYDNCKPIPDSLEGISLLREMGRVIFVTASTNGASGRKFRWLNHNGFDVNFSDYVEAVDKTLIIGNIMIDDNYENIRRFSGAGFLFRQPHNKKYFHPLEIKNWREFIDKRKAIL